MGKLPDTGGATKELTPEMKKYFKSPAKVCQVCGGEMNFSNEWGKWERKWSIHRPCYNQAMFQLDRETGVHAQREQEKQDRERKREEMRRKGYEV